MGYKVIYKGLEVICDSFDALDELAEKASKRSPNVKQQTKNENSLPFENEEPSTFDKLKKMLSELTVAPKAIMVFLAKNSKATNIELLETLGETDNQKIGGYMSTITKKSKKFGLDMIVKSKILDNTTGSRVYQYRLSTKYKNDIEKILL